MTPEREAKLKKVLNNRQSGLVVVLENVHDIHNISAVIRTCDAVGVQDMFVLNNVIQRHARFGYNSAASALKWITVHQFEDTAACFAALRQRCDKIYATHLGTASASLYDIDLTERVALVFGNEKDGVTDGCLAMCDGNFVIPQAGMVQSLNISVACAISLYEAYRQRRLAGMYDDTPKLPETQWKELAKQWKMYE